LQLEEGLRTNVLARRPDDRPGAWRRPARAGGL